MTQKKTQKKQQGWIHGNPVENGWAGAVMRKSLAIQQCYQPTDQLTRQGVDLPVRD